MTRCQGVRRDGERCKAYAMKGSRYCRMHVSQSQAVKLTRQDLLTIIEENDGPAGLDISGRDLSEVDLSSGVIRVEMERRGFPYESPPGWYSTVTGGINLRGAILRGCDLSGARLWRGDYRGIDLSGACLQGSDLGSSTLAGANMGGANLDGAILSRVDVRGADFTRAVLTNADLSGVDLSLAKSIEGVYLCGAGLSSTNIRREQVSDGVGEESDADYYRAREAYLALKNNFMGLGRYDDASWAYIKERRMGKKANCPLRAREFYGEMELSKDAGFFSVLWFYVKHTAKWIGDVLEGVSCGYGERPFRSILCSLVIIVAFAFLYCRSCGLSTTTGVDLCWLDYLQYSLAAFSTMSLPDIIPVNDCGKLLTNIQALSGISILALLMFALGNRIGRS